jgi:hypothetical protein
MIRALRHPRTGDRRLFTAHRFRRTVRGPL